MGCPADGPGPGTALPSQDMCMLMQDMASSGEALCELAGAPAGLHPCPCVRWLLHGLGGGRASMRSPAAGGL